MSHIIGSQQLSQPMSGQPQPVSNPQTSGPPVQSSGPHGYGMPPQSAPVPQTGQQSNAEQKYDLISRVRQLVLSLKESLANLMRVAASNIQHNSQIDSGLKTSEELVVRFDKALEDFFSICNQIELHLKTILECTVQARDSHIYLPFNLNKTDSVSDPSTTMAGDSLSYNQYIMAIKSQVTFAKTIYDMLVEGSKRITQLEPLIVLNPMNPTIPSTVQTQNNSVV